MQRFTDLVSHFESTETEDIETRRWGVEIESPYISKIASELPAWDTHRDESVDEPECECECEECLHSCDCPSCDITNGWGEVDHCGTCTSNEASSPVLYMNTLPQGDRETLHSIADRVDNRGEDNEGGHIHIEARDLTLAQVALIQKAYLHLARIMGERFTGRDFCHYARDYRDYSEDDRLGERYCAVNATNLIRYSGYTWKTWADDADRRELSTMNPKGAPSDTYKSTLEFRQFATTATPAIIEARASLLRALVDYFADGGAWYWFSKADTAEAMIDLLRPQFH